MVETCSVTAANCPCPGFSIHRANGARLLARCGRPFFLSTKDTFQRPPATRWTRIFQNFFCFSNPGSRILATGGAENFSFHSLHHRVLKFAKQNGFFSLLLTTDKNPKCQTPGQKNSPFTYYYNPNRAKWPGTEPNNKKAANLFQTYCFRWPRRWAADILF